MPRLDPFSMPASSSEPAGDRRGEADGGSVPEGTSAEAAGVSPSEDDAWAREADGLGEGRVWAHRVEMPCEDAGFEPPPLRIALRLARAGQNWSMWIRCPPGGPPRVAKWLAQYRPAAVKIDDGLSPRRLRATFPAIPSSWQKVHEEIHVRCIELTSEGTASLFTDDPITKVRWFLDQRRHVEQIGLRTILTGDPFCHLTPRQRDALALAVALGYYEVPRRVTLHEVAERLGMSVGAASELVRRGERLLISGTFDNSTARAWSDASGVPPF